MKVILVTYINRSGSTYLLSRLDNHSQVVSCPEADILAKTFLFDPDKKPNNKEINKITWALLTDQKFSNWGLNKDELLEALNEKENLLIFYKILECYMKKTKPGATYVVFKAVEIINYTSRIIETNSRHNFPLRLIGLIRSPADIFASQKVTYSLTGRKYMNKNLLNTVAQWNLLTGNAYRLSQEDNITIIRYEDMISQKGVYLIRGLKIEPVEDIEDNGEGYYKRIPDIEKPMHKNILKPAMTKPRFLGNDRTTATERTLIEKNCSYYMKLAGYNPRYLIINWKYFVYYIYYSTDRLIFRLKRLLIFLFRREDRIKYIRHSLFKFL